MKAGSPRPELSAWAASDFEFKHRSLIFVAIYLLAFALWPLDRRDVAGVIARLLPVDSARTQISYLIAALPAVSRRASARGSAPSSRPRRWKVLVLRPVR
jgi:hypothetical protein